MSELENITLALPKLVGRELEQAARDQHKSVSELIKEMFRVYQAQFNLQKLADKASRLARDKGLSSQDFGRPFAD